MSFDTPIFDALHRELDAPSMKFMDPDGLMWYGVKIFCHGEPHSYLLRMQGTAAGLNFPALPGPWNGDDA